MFTSNYDALSEHGRAQARTLGEVLAARYREADQPGFDAAFTGPATRQIDTASIARDAFLRADRRFPEAVEIAGFDEHDGEALVVGVLAQVAKPGASALPPELARLGAEAADSSLDRERRMRSWQRLFEAVMTAWLAGEVEVEGVESWLEFHARVRVAFYELRERNKGEVALFTSVGPTAVILHEILGLPALRAFQQAWRLYNTAITRVIYSGERATLDGFNEVAHLPLRDWTHR